VLQDISRADAPAEVLGRARLEPAGQPPFHFAIEYDDAAVRPGRRYAVRAGVTHQGRLLFTTDRNYPALDGGTAPLALLLVSAGRRPVPRARTAAEPLRLPAAYEGELAGPRGPGLWHLDLLPAGRYQLRVVHRDGPEPNRADDIGRWMRDPDSGRLVLRGGPETPVAFAPEDGGAALRRTGRAGAPVATGGRDRLQRLPEPSLIEPRLALTGMFTYMADAASITLCADGRRLPVAMEAEYPALERAYLKARREPGQALLVSLVGLIASRPFAEEGAPPRATLVVERFAGVWPRESCGNPLADSPLRNTYWKLVRLGGAPVEAAEKQTEPHLILAAREPRVSGSGGCNRIVGSFEVEGDRLRLSRMAGSRMACPSGMEQEQRFVQALPNVERYRIRGSHLEMLDATDAVIARFEAVALRS
jgi:copper homeostasis protein (lipoprotein)